VHDRFLLFTLLTGEALTWCNGEVHVLRPGTLLMVEPGSVHRDLRKTSYRALMVMMEGALVDAFRRKGEALRFGSPTSSSPELLAHVMTLADAVRADEPATVQAERVARLLGQLESFWREAEPRAEPPLVARAQRVFLEAPGTHLSLDALAERLGCAPNYLSRVFRDHVGVPPHSYQVLQRVLEARRLIERGQTLASAAEATGFTDESHLYRHFRRRFAIAPGAYPKKDPPLLVAPTALRILPATKLASPPGRERATNPGEEPDPR